MTRRPSYRQTLALVDQAAPTYLPPSLVGSGWAETDSRALALDQAATAFLKRAGKAGRTHERNYTSADRKARQWSPTLEPGKTLERGGGQRMVGVRVHGTGRF